MVVMTDFPIQAYARLNARVMPKDRGEIYEDPLLDVLEESGLGTVSGGGTCQREAGGEIDYCGIDLDLLNAEESVALVCELLGAQGAPAGSRLEFEIDGEAKVVPFGFFQGLAVYLNGTELPDHVYQDCDVNFTWDEINRLLGERGNIQSHWHGPNETALYLYGFDAEEMRALIEPHTSTYPLCQKARIVVLPA